MPGYTFPDPKPMVGTKPVLVVTDYGTIKGDKNFKEQTIDEFIKKIEKYIKSWFIKCDDDTYEHKVTNHTKVINIGDDSYYVMIFEKEYNLKLDVKSRYYPILKNKLDELEKKTKEDLNKENIINDLEQNINLEKHNNQEDLQKYLKFLTSRKKEYLRKFIINTIITVIPNSGFLIGIIASLLLVGPIYGKISLIIGLLFGAVAFNAIIGTLLEPYTKMSKFYKVHKLIKLKINEVNNKLNRVKNVNIKINSQLIKESEEKKDIYKETIINYMNSIMMGANELNKKDRHIILIELRDVLDEYTSRMQEYSTNHDKILTLDDRKRVIMNQTIEKLVTLEMEISEIRKRNNENKLIIDDSADFREKLNGYIDATSDCQVEQSSKVRVRGM